MAIDEELIISFGDSHMMLTPEIDGSIKLVFLEGPRLHDTFSFSKESPPISLGRR